MSSIISFIMSNGADIAYATLAIIGGLKIIARYTPWEGDDKALEFIEAPFKWLADKLPRKGS